ncbi:MAG: hypothetical protein JSS74_06890 [Actinobacteria bacterium]|nr:hypothetical protein [Actinomycetota bacterium]
MIERAAATGRVSARLTVRWRDAVEADALWRFESAVILGAAHAESFLFADDDERGPRVTGVIGWHALAIGDPAVDLAWLTMAADARADVLDAYASATLRAPDAGLGIRARLLAELELARWLLHGHDTRRPDVMDDAAQLLDALADGIHDDLVPHTTAGSGVDDALSALDRVPATGAQRVDTSMQTDAYDAGAFAGITMDDTSAFTPHSPQQDDADGAPDDADGADPDAMTGGYGDAVSLSSDDRSPVTAHADANATEDLSDLREPAPGVPEDSSAVADDDTPAHGDDDQPARPRTLLPSEGGISGEDVDVAEAQRAARAAFQRWTSASSE